MSARLARWLPLAGLIAGLATLAAAAPRLAAASPSPGAAGSPVTGAAVAPLPGAGGSPLPGVADPRQAHIDYMLKCQGCHRPDGTGDDRSNPPLKGMVARFLGVPGGRAFLGRVPGVATTNLDDARLANLLNWTLFRFDAQHVPPAFRPYGADELGRLRQNPLRLERAATRARLVAGFTDSTKGG